MWTKRIPDFLRGRIILSLLIFFTAGIVLAEYGHFSSRIILWCAIPSALFPLAALLLKRSPVWLFFPLVFCLGAFFCAGENAALDAWPYEDGHNIIVCGKVRAISQGEDDWRATLFVDSADGSALRCADIYLYGEGGPPAPGSIIEARGVVFTPAPYANTNAFDYNRYLKQEGIGGSVSTLYTGKVTVLEKGPAFYPGKIGAWLEKGLREAAEGLSERQQALVFGVFLGDKSGLDYGMKNALGLTGALHAFAVSGLHVGFIVAIVLIFLGGAYRRRLPRFIICILFLLVYLSLTGASASVLRASIMAICLLGATLFDEQYDGVTALSLAAFICLIIHPLWLFSAGFQLSFAAVGGIIALTPTFKKLFYPLPGWIGEFFAVTFAAVLATLPLVCYYFYHISWLGWLLSPLLILAAGITVMLSFVATFIAVFFPWLAGIFLEAAAYAMGGTFWLCDRLSQLPFSASVTGAIPGWTAALFLGILAFIPFLFRKYGRWITVAVLTVLLLLFTIFAPKSFISAPVLAGPLTEIVFIDVGQGDCALIISPQGQTILIDGGGNPWNPGAIGEYSLLPYLKSRGITRINLMINSHPDADHTDGLLSVLAYLEVDRLACADIWDDNDLAGELSSAAAENGTSLLDVRAGDAIQVGDDLTLRFYYPPGDFTLDGDPVSDTNAASLVCEISYGSIDILFTGDISGDLLSGICAEYRIEAEMIKVSHHGSLDGYGQNLAELLGTKAAIICVGKDNSYGHPSKKVVEYWQEYGEVYRTDTDGSISVYTNGTEYAILTYY